MFKFLTLILSAWPNMKHFIRTFSIMRAYSGKLIAIEEAQNCIHQKHFPKWLGGGYAYPPGHKLQKTSNRSGIFQSLGTINIVTFY